MPGRLQTSIDPPRFAVWISRANHTAEVAACAPTMVVHVLREDDRHLAEVFGELTGDDVDKFSLVEWSPAAGGVPALAGCDHFVGRVVQTIDTEGDHQGYLLEPGPVVWERRGSTRLGLRDAEDLDPGHPA
jgi:flavin reductase (DIM6/NTAB) family NADH-FMN oxidoreductase RutF